MNDTYKVISKFDCCGKTMVTVIMNMAACVMEEKEYRKMVYEEKRFNSRKKVA